MENIDNQLSVYSATGCTYEQPIHTDTSVYRDPRLNELGWRLLANSDKLRGMNNSYVECLAWPACVSHNLAAKLCSDVARRSYLLYVSPLDFCSSMFKNDCSGR